MALVTVSRGTYSGGREVARLLAERLGYAYLSREELAEAALEAGVPVDRLQEAMHKPPLQFQELAQERRAYLSFVKARLCENILEKDIVYDGHAGHMLLSGIPNVLRVRVVADLDYRVHMVMNEMGKSLREAREYISLVDFDRDRWSRFLYNVDWRDLFYYDMLINISQTGINHAVDALAEAAGREEYRFGQDTRSAIENLWLASRAEFRLLNDERTRDARLTVDAHDQVLYITARSTEAEHMPAVQAVLKECIDSPAVRTMIVSENVLLVQDRFDRSTRSLERLADIAEDMDAAIHLLRLARPDAAPGAEFFERSDSHEIETGIEIHDAGRPTSDSHLIEDAEDDLETCADELDRRGRSAGFSTFYGTADWLISHLEAMRTHTLVILGDLFLNHPPSVRIRLREDLARRISERLKVPALTTEEITRRMHFTAADAGILSVLLLSAAAMLALMFLYQDELVAFMNEQRPWTSEAGVAIAVTAVALLFAFLYGSAVHRFLRLIRLD